VFAGYEGIAALGVAAGAAIAPLAIDLLGIRGALVAMGLVGPLAVIATWPALRRLDADMRVRDADIELLQTVPMLCVLPEATIEQLAAGIERGTVRPGEPVFAQGDHGDRVYVIDDGGAEVLHSGHMLRTLGRGECFGEIALLHDTVRTATVRAAAPDPLELVALTRDRFLVAVTGYCPSSSAGRSLVAKRLEEIDRLAENAPR
jgi:CRP-like cAMP-binding protein